MILLFQACEVLIIAVSVKGISKSEAVNILQNDSLSEKSGTKYIFFFIVYNRWIKKLERLAILKLKDINFIALKILFFKMM